MMERNASLWSPACTPLAAAGAHPAGDAIGLIEAERRAKPRHATPRHATPRLAEPQASARCLHAGPLLLPGR